MDAECLEASDECKGEISFYSSPRGSGRAFPRCEYHLEKRVEQEQITNERYPVNAPSDFDPAYAGERWDEDY